MLTLNNLIYGGGSYAEGAKTITAGKPKADGNIDIKHPAFARKTREQINWLNVNEPDIQSIISSLTSKTMGVSINIQVESPSEEFNKQAEELIEEHCGYELINGEDRAVGELSGKHHFNSFARQLSDFTGLNGGIIVRHHYSNAWAIPYKYELVGVDMIDISKTTTMLLDRSKGRQETTINGIVRNKYGAITHLWLYTNEDKTQSKPIPYQDLTYYSEVWINIDQQTAVSKLTSILSRLDMSTQYGIAELEAAIEEAKAGHYIESQAYAELMKIVGEEISKANLGSGKIRIEAARDLVTPILREMSNLGIKAKGLTPIAQGDKVSFNTAKRDSAYKDMNQNSEMKIAASQGMSDIGIYSKAADANYSSIKYTLETDQRTADIRFDEIKNKVFYGIFSRLIQVGIQIGRITNRAAYWKNPNRFHKFRYLRQNKIDTEPAKNALANKTNIELGLKTKGQIIEEQSGQKYETYLKKQHEQKLLELNYEVQLEVARQKAFKENGIIPTEKKETNKTEDKIQQAFFADAIKEIW